ncbi:MAG: hypothetical protein NZ893_02370 [Candidatus Aenigmarchaeota archaeon]|nr:hypothetical protein [Candidatus Aenigmarchaeota archaeon]
MKKIIIFSAPTGHASLAEAAKSFLKELPNTKIKILDVMEDKFAWDFYKFSYRFMPFFTKLPYELSKNENIIEIIKNYFFLKYRKKILSIIKKEKPDMIITTYFGYIPVLDDIKPISNFKFINIVSDPVNIHPMILSREADYNIGYGKYVTKIGKKLKLKNVLAAGWLVRKDFFEKLNRKKVAEKYKLDEERLTLLICGGSEGSNAVLTLLPLLFFSRMDKDFQVIFVCGNNAALKNIINRTYNIAKKVNHKVPEILVVGFTNKLNELMGISDVVIGKAGPNLLFESVSMMKPFIAITHISGQEDGNLELIKKLKFGWVAEDPVNSNKIIRKIIENPSILKKYKHLEKYSEMNFETGKKLVEIVKNVLNI